MAFFLLKRLESITKFSFEFENRGIIFAVYLSELKIDLVKYLFHSFYLKKKRFFYSACLIHIGNDILVMNFF